MKNVTSLKDLKCHIVNNLNLNQTHHCVALLWVATSLTVHNCETNYSVPPWRTIAPTVLSISSIHTDTVIVKFNMGAKRVWNQILDDVLYQSNEFGFYLHEFVISLHLHKTIFFELLWRSKFRGTVNTICLNFLLFPPRPQAILYFCAPLYTLPCPKSVCSSQHCLEGGEEGNSRYPGG